MRLLKRSGQFLAFILAAWAMGCLVAFAAEWVTKGTAQSAWAWCAGAPVYFLFTGLLYGAPILLLGALTNQLWLGLLAVAPLALALALVDYFKIRIDGTPLEVVDFGMVRQLDYVMEVAGDLTPPDHLWHVVGVLVCAVAVLFLLRKAFRPPCPQLRFLSVTLILALGLMSVTEAGAVALGRSFGVDMENRIASRIAYRDYGLTLGLWREYFLLANHPPEGYGPAYMEDVLARLDDLLAQTADALPPAGKDPAPNDGEAVASGEAPEAAPPAGGTGKPGGTKALPEADPSNKGWGGQDAQGETQAPNILYILSESFYDMTTLPGLSLSADPLETFHRLQDESISGRFYTTYLGYGTGYIEASLLTGVTSKDVKPGTNLCFRPEEEYTLFDSVATPFQQAGYAVEMLHAYNDSLYNRLVTYPLLGFDKLLFSKEIQALDLAIQGSPYAGGYYLSDHVFTQALLNRMETANTQGKPAFLFGITMENHQPFDAEKFGNRCQIDMESTVLSREDLKIAKVMLEGITRADQALNELTEALRETDYPTIVVFFGDHRPNLFMTDGDTVYSHLGLCDGNDSSNWTVEQVAALYSTDYLIWANDPALLQGRAGQRQDSSLTALSPTLLELAEAPVTRYWAMQRAYSQMLLVDTELYCVDGSGTPHWTSGEVELTDQEQELAHLRSAVMYDALYGQRYITQRMNEAVGSG